MELQHIRNAQGSLRALSAVFCFLMISGCVATAERITEIQPNTLKPDTNVGVVWISPCSTGNGCKASGQASNLGEFAPDGASGLLIYGAVLAAHSDIIEALDQVSADALIEENFLNPVAMALEKRNVIPKVDTAFHYQGDLSNTGKRSTIRLTPTLNELHPESQTISPHTGFAQNFDLSAVADELDTSTLVVLHLQNYGVRRSFGPFGVPLGRPYGLSLVRAYIWDVETESVLYNDFAIARADIGPNWREEGHWTKVFTATDGALELALDRVVSPLVSALEKP